MFQTTNHTKIHVYYLGRGGLRSGKELVIPPTFRPTNERTVVSIDFSSTSPTIHQFEKTCANRRQNTVMKWPLLQETFLFPENAAASLA